MTLKIGDRVVTISRSAYGVERGTIIGPYGHAQWTIKFDNPNLIRKLGVSRMWFTDDRTARCMETFLNKISPLEQLAEQAE